MTLAAIDARLGTLEWIGVGNVDAVVVHAEPSRAPSALILSGGVVGYRLPVVRVRMLTLSPGDLLVMATDGVRAEFAEDIDPGLDPQPLAEALLAQFGKASDDALVLVVRYRGLAPP